MFRASIAVILSAWMFAAMPAAAQDRLAPLDIVQSGHSLTDSIIAPLADMIRAAVQRGGRLDAATIPGSPMDWRWANETVPDIRQAQVMDDYDVLVITERVSLSHTVPWHDSKRWALHWFTHAWENGARSVLYASWTDVVSGPEYENPYGDPEGHVPFRDRLPLELARWQAMLDHVNANRPAGSPAMTMIPGPQIMMRAYDDIAAGRAPGLSDIAELFADDIHLNPLGSYLIALGHFAVIFDADPRGLPAGVPAQGGPDAAQAAWMQALVWDVVRETRR